MSNFKHLQLKETMQKADTVRTWLDYLRLNFIQKIDFFEIILEKINTTNTNFVIIDELTYTKINLPTGPSLQISTTYNDLPVPIMLFNLFKCWTVGTGYGRLDFYGMYFRLFDLWEFTWNYIDWAKKYIYWKTKEIPKITRVDYCIDMMYDRKKDFLSYTKYFTNINKASKIYEISTWKGIESWSIGSKSAKRYVLRMYDKKLDISSKGKQRFYDDYLHFWAVHRFEAQFGPHFCKWFSFNDLDNLQHKINAFLWLTEKHFEGVLFYVYDTKYDINDFNKLFFTKHFIWKAKKFMNSNISPYQVIFDYFINNVSKTTHYPMLYDIQKTIWKIKDLTTYLK